VVTRSISIDSDPDITDRDRRRGAFIAHCLLINRYDFARLDNNPMPLFDACDWISDPREMVDRLGKANGSMPPVTLQVTRETASAVSKWSLAEARKLIALALKSSESATAGKMVLILGDAATIEEALEVTLALTPRSWRVNCTFDTAVDGCTGRPGQFWAGGVTSRQDGRAIQVSANERRVLASIPIRLDQADPYLYWLTLFPPDTIVAEVTKRAETFQDLTSAVSRQAPWPVEEVDDRTAEEFLALNRDRVQRLVAGQVSLYVGASKAADLASYLMSEVTPQTSLQLASASTTDGQQLCNLVTDWIIDRHPNLPDDDWRRIREFARDHDSPRLLWLAAVLAGRVDTMARDEALAAMEDATFQNILDYLDSPVAPVHFVARNHLDTLLIDPRIVRVSEQEFMQMMKEIMRADAISRVECLSPCVSQLGDSSLTELETMLRGQSEMPEAFHQAMIERRTVLGQSRNQLGIVDRFKGLLGKKED
ncbi:MAG: hypothetical protein ABTQ73_11690, partial [Caldilineales bacterium]